MVDRCSDAGRQNLPASLFSECTAFKTFCRPHTMWIWVIPRSDEARDPKSERSISTMARPQLLGSEPLWVGHVVFDVIAVESPAL